MRQCAKILSGLQGAQVEADQRQLDEQIIIAVRNATALFSRSTLLDFFTFLDKDESDGDPIAFFDQLSKVEGVSEKTVDLEKLFERLRKHAGLTRTEGNKSFFWNAADPMSRIAVTVPYGYQIRHLGQPTKLRDQRALYPIKFNSLVGDLIRAKTVKETQEIISAFSNAYSRSSKQNPAFIYFFSLSIMDWFYLKDGYEPWAASQTTVVNDTDIAHQAILPLELNAKRAMDDFERIFSNSSSQDSKGWSLSAESGLALIQMWLHFSPHKKTRLVKLLGNIAEKYPQYRDDILWMFLDLHLAWLDNSESWRNGEHPLSILKSSLKYSEPVKYVEGAAFQMDLLAAMLYETALFSEARESKGLSPEQIFLEASRRVRTEPDFNYGPEESVEETIRHFMPGYRSFRAAAEKAEALLGP